MKTITEKEKKQRKFLVMIPVLTLPFILLLFWALGGGLSASGQTESAATGLNTSLPDAALDGKEREDKLSLYSKAKEDSLRLEEQMRNDPYYALPDAMDTSLKDLDQVPADTRFAATGDPNVDAIHSRLSRLYTSVHEPLREGFDQAPPSNEMDQMQQLLQSMDNGGGTDPEMAQLEGMLDKILDIQNPQRARDRLRDQSLKNRKQVYAVSSKKNINPVSDLRAKNDGRPGANGFYEWSGTPGAVDEPAAVGAVIQHNATVVSGATLKLRLTDDIFVKGILVPKGTFVYGICALNGDRLQVSLNSIRHINALYPVNLIAYDMDGVAGIYMPGAISRDVAKNSAQDAIQGVDYYNVDNSLSSQAASVGIQAAKSLFSKKAKLIKVTVRAGYRLLLKDANAND